MSGGNKKVTHTWTNLQLKAAGLFKYWWLFCYHQAFKGYKCVSERVNCILHYHLWQMVFSIVVVTGKIFLNLLPQHTRPWVERCISFIDSWNSRKGTSHQNGKCFMNYFYADFDAFVVVFDVFYFGGSLLIFFSW